MMYCHVVYVSREGRTSSGEAFNICLFVLWELTVSSRLRSRAQDETWLGPSCWKPFVWRWPSSALSLPSLCLPVERAPKSQTEARIEKGERRDKIGTMAVTICVQRPSPSILYFRTSCHIRSRSRISAASNLPKLAPGLLSPTFFFVSLDNYTIPRPWISFSLCPSERLAS